METLKRLKKRFRTSASKDTLVDRLTYTSEMEESFRNFDKISEMCAQAAKNNVEHSINGELMVDNDFGLVFQSIEAKAEALDALWEKIQVDPRHKNVTLIKRVTEVKPIYAGAGGMELVLRSQANKNCSSKLVRRAEAISPSLSHEQEQDYIRSWGPALGDSGRLWIIPLVAAVAFLLFPIAAGEGKMSAFLFLTWYSIYAITCALSLMVVTFVGIPLPNNLQQLTIFMSYVIGSVVCAYLLIKANWSFTQGSGAFAFMTPKLFAVVATPYLVYFLVYLPLLFLFAHVQFRREHEQVSKLRAVSSQLNLQFAKPQKSQDKSNGDIEMDVLGENERASQDHEAPDEDSLVITNASSFEKACKLTIGSVAWGPPFGEQLKGFVFLLKIKTAKELRARLWRGVLGQFLSVIAFGTCHAFLFRFLSNSSGFNAETRSVLTVLFPLSLQPTGFVLRRIGKKIDETSQNNASLSMENSFAFFMYLYQLFFYRMLFVTAVDTMDVAILTGIQILASLFNYGFRMSRPYYHIKFFFLTRILRRPLHTVDSIEYMKKERVISFYFLCMAERISITIFPIFLAINALGPNSAFSNYNPCTALGKGVTSCDKSEGLGLQLFLNLIVLAIEWTGSTVVTLILLMVFKRNALTEGALTLRSPQMRMIASLATVRVMMDVYLSLYNLDKLEL